MVGGRVRRKLALCSGSFFGGLAELQGDLLRRNGRGSDTIAGSGGRISGEVLVGLEPRDFGLSE